MKKVTILMSLFALNSMISCNSGTDTKNTTDSTAKKDSVVATTAAKDSTAVSFQKKLSLQGITYDITTSGNGSTRNLTIVPTGFKGTVDKIVMTCDPITNAEVEDLDADGFPELLIYTQSAGSGTYGNVIGYSPNKGVSLSQIYFPETDKNSPVMKGYMGHDEFAIVESTLVRRFKTYESSDANAKPTGKMRQIEYKLKEGEASKKFVMGKSTDIAL
ncbi:MAG: hypothetical protein NTZ19_10855 [Bacteroidetes bacterium]|nr:hypothetical protein [Bacteroidota bacterium]